MTTRRPSRVLFVCVRNGGKSQMAAGLMRSAAAAAGLEVDVDSAGTRAGDALNAQSVAALAEVGVDIAGQRPRQLTEQDVRDADLVVVLGAEARVEPGEGVEATPVELWETDEPSARGIEGEERMRLLRDDIAARVEELVARLAVTRS